MNLTKLCGAPSTRPHSLFCRPRRLESKMRHADGSGNSSSVPAPSPSPTAARESPPRNRLNPGRACRGRRGPLAACAFFVDLQNYKLFTWVRSLPLTHSPIPQTLSSLDLFPSLHHCHHHHYHPPLFHSSFRTFVCFIHRLYTSTSLWQGREYVQCFVANVPLYMYWRRTNERTKPLCPTHHCSFTKAFVSIFQLADCASKNSSN